MNELVLGIIVLVAIGLGKWLVYTGLLWAMIKVQKLNYNFLGLFASSFAGTALTYIPVVGPYIGWAVLVLCLWKCTGADIVPEVFFTVTIASALMFCVNLFVIGALMGDLRPIHVNARGLDDFNEAGEYTDDEAEEGVANAEAARVRPASGAVSNSVASATKNPAPTATVFKDARTLPIKLSLKGVTLSGNKSAMISVGKQIHTVNIGEAVSIPAAQGMMKFVCEEITPSSVVLTLEKGEKVRLSFH